MEVFCEICKNFYNDENGVCSHCEKKKNKTVIRNQRFVIGNPPPESDCCDTTKPKMEEYLKNKDGNRKIYPIKIGGNDKTSFPKYIGPNTIGEKEQERPGVKTFPIGGNGGIKLPTPIKPFDPPQKGATPSEPAVYEKNVWLVYQGQTFECEFMGGYVWAPLRNKEGRSFAHWDNVSFLKKGDIILHSVYRHIVAVSVVESEKPSICSHPDNAWGDGYDEGRKVKCKYCPLRDPVSSKELLNVILENYYYQNSPFNRNGGGNQGYMYRLHKKIFKAYAEKIKEYNPYVEEKLQIKLGL